MENTIENNSEIDSAIKEPLTPCEVVDSVSKSETEAKHEFKEIEICRPLLKPVLLCLATSFGGFIFGWDVGVIGGISNMLAFKNTFGNLTDPETGLNHFSDILIGLIIAVFNIGCAVGGLTLAKVGDIIGRRMGIFIVLGIYSIGVSIQIIYSTKWYQFFIGRIITGLAIGTTAVLIPMFISESAPMRIRGAMVVLYQLMITLGILLGNFVNYFCRKAITNELSNKNWMIPTGLGILWAAIVFLGLTFTPESAHYLANKGKLEAAKTSFGIMNSLNRDDPFVDAQVRKLEKKTYNDDNGKKKEDRWEFITGEPSLFLRLFTGIMVMAFQQLTGVNYFFYYGTSLFSSVGIEDSYMTAIILSSVNFTSTFIGIYIVERLGRKACLILGSVGMFIAMSVYASVGSFALENNNETKTPGVIMIVFTCIYILFFACTSGPVSFVFISELFPTRTKNISMAICTSVNWIMNFLISLFTPAITHEIGFKYGFVFATCLLLSTFFFYNLVPETKGLSINQIDELYLRKLKTKKCKLNL